MKLRKKQIKVRKNFSFPRWIFRNPSEEIFDFLGVVYWRLASVTGANGATSGVPLVSNL